MRVEVAGDVVRKSAESSSERRRLAGEAAVLRAAAHPGIVELVAVDNPCGPDALVLRRVEGIALAEQVSMPPEVLSWTGAALCTTIADLHDIGVVHLALDPSHVVIDSAGRPLLCGFGEARRLTAGEELDTAKQRDVVTLARLLIGAAEDPSATPGIKALRTAAGGGRARWSRRGTDARSLARALAAAGPTASRPPLKRGRRLAAAALVVVATLAVIMHAHVATRRSPVEAGLPRGTCPPVDDGCHAIPASQDVLLGRFRIQGVVGAALLGRWDCGPNSTPAVLDGRTGRLWVFDAWPGAGRATTGRLVATVPGAYAPVVIPGPGSLNCDSIELSRRGAHPLVVNVPRR